MRVTFLNFLNPSNSSFFNKFNRSRYKFESLLAEIESEIALYCQCFRQLFLNVKTNLSPLVLLIKVILVNSFAVINAIE